jgi:hypothetical protein
VDVVPPLKVCHRVFASGILVDRLVKRITRFQRPVLQLLIEPFEELLVVRCQRHFS